MVFVQEYRREDGIRMFRYMGGWVVETVLDTDSRERYYLRPDALVWETGVVNLLPFRFRCDDNDAIRLLRDVKGLQ